MKLNNLPNENPHSSDSWDDELLWEDIATELDKDKKKRRAFFWLFGSTLLVLTAITASLNYSYNSKDSKQLDSVSISPEATDHTTKTQQPDQHQTTTLLQHSQTKKTINTNTNNTSSELEKQKRTTSQISVPHYSSLTSTKSAPSKKSQTTNSIKTFLVDPLEKTTQTAPVSNENGLLQTLNSLPLLRAIALLQNDKINERKLNEKASTIPSIATKGKSFITISSGYSFLSNKVTAEGSWAQKMKEAETALYTINTAVSYNHPIYKRIYLGIGLQYSRRISSFNAVEIDTSYTEIMSDTAIIVNSEPQAGFLTRTRKTQTTYTSFNRYHTFRLPLQIGFIYNRGKNSLNVSTGVTLYLTSIYKGYYFSPQESIVDLNSVRRPKFLNFQSASLSVDYGRTVLSDLNIFIGCRYTVPLNANFQISISENESYSSLDSEFNLFLGFRKKI